MMYTGRVAAGNTPSTLLCKWMPNVGVFFVDSAKYWQWPFPLLYSKRTLRLYRWKWYRRFWIELGQIVIESVVAWYRIQKVTLRGYISRIECSVVLEGLRNQKCQWLEWQQTLILAVLVREKRPFCSDIKCDHLYIYQDYKKINPTTKLFVQRNIFTQSTRVFTISG